MHDNRVHHLLEQVALTVSPFVNLPTTTTLPYTYKTMPSTLPQSVSGIAAASSASDPAHPDGGADAKPRYVISGSGHAAHPDDIMASCRALQAHVAKLQADAEAELRALDERIRARELAEKRRVAPGWLDSDARMLEPERKGPGAGDHPMDGFGGGVVFGDGPGAVSEMAVPDEGEELDRAFGKLGLGQGQRF
ncbi:hypothetical protein GQ53DRAFT_837422 [Thozetella sp. PMI_491]|nr:hypothetical protein GQ53DRAFT_837422 [Thozetella sp. PMI_491]